MHGSVHEVVLVSRAKTLDTSSIAETQEPCETQKHAYYEHE